MTDVYLGFAVFLMANILAGMVRIARGPTPADLMLAAQLFGTMGVGILLLLSQGFRVPALQNVALVLALLAAVAGIAFVQRAWPPPSAHERDGDGH